MLYPIEVSEDELYAELINFPETFLHVTEVCSVGACEGNDGMAYLIIKHPTKDRYFLYTLFPTDHAHFPCAGPCGGSPLLALVSSGLLVIPPPIQGFVDEYLSALRQQLQIEKVLKKPLAEAFFAASLSIGSSYTVSDVSFGHNPDKMFGLILYLNARDDDVLVDALEEVYETARKNVEQILVRSGWIIDGNHEFYLEEQVGVRVFIPLRINANRKEQLKSYLQ